MACDKDRIQTPLARARGLGSAHDGVHHWVMQRVTSLAAIPLILWLVWSTVHIPSWDYDQFRAWQAMPRHAILMILSVMVVFYHTALGCQVILEDYVEGRLCRFAKITAINLLLFAMGVVCIFAVLKIALG